MTPLQLAVGTGASILAGEWLSFAHPGVSAPAVDGVNVRVEPGRLAAVLGPNGAGKSTLVGLLSGGLLPRTGRVTFGGRPVRELSGRTRALAIAVVTQSEPSAFPITVRELVAMGRYPHRGAWERAGPRDAEAVEDALERCSAGAFASRSYDALSGGERQRVRIARALAQRAPVLLLDEPTAGLDLRFRMEVFQLLRGLCAEGLAVLVVTHDLNMAARFADDLLLLERGRPVAYGSPGDVVLRDRLEPVYGWPLRITAHPGPGVDEGAPQAVALRRAER